MLRSDVSSLHEVTLFDVIGTNIVDGVQDVSQQAP